ANQFKKVIELDPQLVLPHRWLAKTYLLQKRYEEAIAEFQKAMALSGGGAELAPALGYLYGVMGNRRAALEVLEAVNKHARTHYVSPFHLAPIFLVLGEK